MFFQPRYICIYIYIYIISYNDICIYLSCKSKLFYRCSSVFVCTVFNTFFTFMLSLSWLRFYTVFFCTGKGPKRLRRRVTVEAAKSEAGLSPDTFFFEEPSFLLPPPSPGCSMLVHMLLFTPLPGTPSKRHLLRAISILKHLIRDISSETYE